MSNDSDVSSNEIKITPEMIQAGRNVLYDFPIMDPDEESMGEAVREVFLAMMKSAHSTSQIEERR
jgi:hypothetical protein